MHSKVGAEELNTLRGHTVEHMMVKPVNKLVLMEKILKAIPLAG